MDRRLDQIERRLAVLEVLVHRLIGRESQLHARDETLVGRIEAVERTPPTSEPSRGGLT